MSDNPSVWLRRSALLAIAALAGLAYAWQLGRDPLEPYYAAAVRAMAGSWHDFAYGALDPASTITLDKLPGAFWLQALSVRAFGYSAWAMILPQVVEGVLTVLAADAVSAAIVRGGTWWRLIVAGGYVGLAFQAKMIEAWLVLPALGLAYLISGQGTAGRRIRQLVAAGVVAAIVSLAWISAVSLVPAGSRPYADGSHDNSLYQQVFVYNGFGRFGEQTPLQLLTGELGARQSVLELASAPPGPSRLLESDLGRDTGWLLPAAALIALAGLAGLRRQPRGDPLRAAFILWGCWLVTLPGRTGQLRSGP